MTRTWIEHLLESPALRWLMVRLAVAVLLVVGVLTTSPAHGLAAWTGRVCVVVCAVLLVLWAPDGVLPWGAVVRPPVRWATLTGIVLAVTVSAVAAPASPWVWVCFVPAVIAARNLALAPALAVSALPAAATAYATWTTTGTPWAAAAMAAAMLATVVFIRVRVERREAAELAAAQQEALAQERAKATASAQREVVAAQVHDVLAHTLSGLIVSLQTAQLQASREGASEALTTRLSDAAGLAREGLKDAAAVVAQLSGQAARPARDISELVASFQRASRTRATVTGSLDLMPESRRPVASAVVGEALTNSMRYSRGCDVRVGMTPTEVVVQTLGAASESPDHHGSGRGLAGLRSRVAATGGTLNAGMTDDGWRVVASWDDTTSQSEQSRRGRS